MENITFQNWQRLFWWTMYRDGVRIFFSITAIWLLYAKATAVCWCVYSIRANISCLCNIGLHFSSVTCKISVRFEERQKFKSASQNIRLMWLVEVQRVKRVGHAWMRAAPAHYQQLNRPWHHLIVSTPRDAAVADAEWASTNTHRSNENLSQLRAYRIQRRSYTWL